jgi:predicted metal-dependent hydrolase
MKFYLKFTSLPFIYSVVETSNSKNALKEASKYRSDAVVFPPTTKLFSFEEALDINKNWVQKELSSIEEKDTYNVYKCVDGPGLVVEGEPEQFSLNRNNILAFAKEKTGKRGVIWASDKRGLVFGVKKGNLTKPLLVFERIETLKLK